MPRSDPHRIRGCALVASGDVSRARPLGEHAVALARQTQWPEAKGEALLALASIYEALGQADEARTTAAEAASVFAAKEHFAGLRRTEALQSRLGLR